MLEYVNLDLALQKEEYRKRLRPLQQRLYELEHAVFDAKIPVIILFEGLGSYWQGTSDQFARGAIGSTRLPRCSDHTAAHCRAALSVDVALLAQDPCTRTSGGFRHILVSQGIDRSFEQNDQQESVTRLVSGHRRV